MDNHPRVRNLAVLIILGLIFTIPAIFIEHDRMLDIVSLLMLVFGVVGIYLIANETWASFWDGARDRASLALYGLFALFLSVVVMRSYGILTRNVESVKWLETTHVYAAMVYVQFAGLWLFSRASTQGELPTRRNKWGQLIAGIIIGSIIASSKVLEPILAGMGKLMGRFL